MDAEQRRLIRNEKARRRTALKYACRYLPIELEKKIFNYMKNPNNGRIDVSMKWQKHPVAKIISDYIAVFNGLSRYEYLHSPLGHKIDFTINCTGFSDIIVSAVTLTCNHGMAYHVAQIFLRELSMFLKTNFQLRFKRNIALRCIPIMKRALVKETKNAHPHSQFVNQLTATYKTFFRNLAPQFGRLIHLQILSVLHR